MNAKATPAAPEYVTVHDDLLDDPERLLPLFRAGLAYAQARKAKPTRR